MTTKKKTRRRIRRIRRRAPKDSPPLYRNAVELSVTYKGVDGEKDAAVRAALGKFDTGSGFAFGGFGDGVRDHSASVPPAALPRVLAKLKAIRGIKTKRLVTRWVLCR